MYASQSYHYTSYKWHRLGNAAEIVTFIIEGLCQSNNGQYISLTKGTEDLTYLWFKHNIFNGNSPTPAPNIPLTWRGRWGDGLVYGEQVQWGWTPITPNPNVTMLIDEVCDHWFQFEGTFEIPYHQPDGHYQLTMAGCPAPEL
jgi:hypothetical protein